MATQQVYSSPDATLTIEVDGSREPTQIDLAVTNTIVAEWTRNGRNWFSQTFTPGNYSFNIPPGQRWTMPLPDDDTGNDGVTERFRIAKV